MMPIDDAALLVLAVIMFRSPVRCYYLARRNLSVAAAVIVAALAIIEVREPCRGVPSEARD